MHSLSCIETSSADDRVQSGSTQHHTLPALTKNPSHNVSSHRRLIAEAATLSQAPDESSRRALHSVLTGCGATTDTEIALYMTVKEVSGMSGVVEVLMPRRDTIMVRKNGLCISI